MTTRIRYSTLENNSLVSKNVITYNNTDYSVVINPDFSWKILTGEDLVKTGTSTNFAYAKKAVRFAFLTLGVNLGSETRTRKVFELDVAAKIV